MEYLVGKKLGQYEIREKIGEGGMASVFKAYQANLNRFVAIKVMSARLMDDPTLAERFQREARAVAQLNHPNILQVYDFGRQDNLNYIVMRYVPNSITLSTLMEKDPPLEVLIDYIAQTADALNYAHEHGIVHRDIKPSNVLIDGKWALLADFGLVKQQSTEVSLTNTGTGMGTPAYMSPEQARGVKIDHRTDIYALGVILHKILTKTIPHNAPTPLAIMVKRTTEPVRPIREIKPDVSKSMEFVTMRALEQLPERRYASATEFATALQKAYADPDYIEEMTLPSLTDSEPTVYSGADIEAEKTMPGDADEPKTVVPAAQANKTPLLIGGGVAVLIILLTAFLLFGGQTSPAVGDDAAGNGAGEGDDTVTAVDDSAETTAAAALPGDEATDKPEAPEAVPTEPPAPQTPQAVAGQELEIWSGPGEGYTLLGYMPVDSSAEIVSRDQSGDWWQIKTPLGGQGVGWILADDDYSRAVNANGVPIAIAPPTLTPTASATPTPQPPTPTPEATATAMSTVTPLPTATSAAPAVVNTPAPTATPTSAVPQGEIVLLEPASLEEPSYGPTEFEWQWSGPLPEDQGFEVRVWRDGEPPAGVHNAVLDNQDGTVQSLANDTYRLNADITDAAGVLQRSGNYNWTVLLVQLEPEYKELGVQAPAGQLRFDMPGTGGGGGGNGGSGGGGGGFN